MVEFMPHLAPVVVLLFLGTIFLIGVSFLLLFYGAVRRSPLFTRVGGGAALTITAGYFILLTGVSFASSEKVLPPGGWKYFCEIDCHIAYSLIGVQTAGALGPEMQQVAAHGKFVVVQVKTWFDERTISAHRGNGPLTPNRRKVLLVDDRGRSFALSPEGQMAFAQINEEPTPLTKVWRPAERKKPTLVSVAPIVARKHRLLITEVVPETNSLFGNENSFYT